MKCKKNSKIHKSLLMGILEADIKEAKVRLLELVIEESCRLDLFNSKQTWVL